MSIPYEEIGRTQQKRRTRTALIEAARALIATGITPTVEEAAMSAGISRTTAYRYFGNQRDLLVAAHPEIDAPSLLGDDPPDDIAERLDHVVAEVLRITLDNEPAMRTMLRLSLEAEGAHREQLLLRRGRATEWLSDALDPLRGRLPRKHFDRLVYAIRTCAGIEPLVWLCDVAGLSRDQAIDLMRWSAQSLLRSALAEAGITDARPGSTTVGAASS